MKRWRDNRTSESGLKTKVIEIKRVSKKTKGGNQIGFTALVAVGDGNGKLGIGLAKAKDVSSAIHKAIRRAEKLVVSLSLRGEEKTIPHPLLVKYKATQLLLKPAPVGTGVIAGGAVRSTLDVSGVENVVAKVIGSRNRAAVAHAILKAFKLLAND